MDVKILRAHGDGTVDLTWSSNGVTQSGRYSITAATGDATPRQLRVGDEVRVKLETFCENGVAGVVRLLKEQVFRSLKECKRDGDMVFATVLVLTVDETKETYQRKQPYSICTVKEVETPFCAAMSFPHYIVIVAPGQTHKVNATFRVREGRDGGDATSHFWVNKARQILMGEAMCVVAQVFPPGAAGAAPASAMSSPVTVKLGGGIGAIHTIGASAGACARAGDDEVIDLTGAKRGESELTRVALPCELCGAKVMHACRAAGRQPVVKCSGGAPSNVAPTPGSKGAMGPMGASSVLPQPCFEEDHLVSEDAESARAVVVVKKAPADATLARAQTAATRRMPAEKRAASPAQSDAVVVDWGMDVVPEHGDAKEEKKEVAKPGSGKLKPRGAVKEEPKSDAEVELQTQSETEEEKKSKGRGTAAAAKPKPKMARKPPPKAAAAKKPPAPKRRRVGAGAKKAQGSTDSSSGEEVV